MKTRLIRMLMLGSATVLAAWADQSPVLESMQAAQKLRAEAAANIASGKESAASAVKRLVSEKNAGGFGTASDGEVAYAKLDTALRLLALDRREAAEIFFRSAEESYESAARQALARGQVRERARYLQDLAQIQAQYLNKLPAAKANIEEAMRLQPGDKALSASLSRVARGHGDYFKPIGEK